jgi:2Fe-2S ferredoxin
MPNIVFIEPDGTRRDVAATHGETIMEAGTRALVRGIIGDCGGYLNCATCHGYVDAGSPDALPPVTDMEDDMLDCAFDRQANSRLTCQIRMDDSLDGIVVRLPARQM